MNKKLNLKRKQLKRSNASQFVTGVVEIMITVFLGNMTATLTINFEDGTYREIPIVKVLEASVPGTQEVSFRETSNGQWIMVMTKSVRGNKKLSKFGFLSAAQA